MDAVGEPAFTQAIRLLINGMHPPAKGPDGVEKEITDRDLAARINAWVAERGIGRPVSHTHLAKLRRSTMKPNPTLELLETFAGYFGVSLDTFASPQLAAERAEQLRFVALMRDRQDVIAVLMRGGDEVTRRAVEALVNIQDPEEDSTDGDG